MSWLQAYFLHGSGSGGRFKLSELLTQFGIAGLILLITLVLLGLDVPRRVAFFASRGAFEAYAAQSPVQEYGAAELNQWLGVFWVDEYAADPRGGVYFRVFRTAVGIGPDTMSYGFVRQPNPHGSPFGAAHYRYFPIGGGWYWFRDVR